MSSNQVYRNDLGLGSSKYVPMTGNNIYLVSGTPIVVAPQVSRTIPFVTTPLTDYSKNYISLDNVGNISILQDGIYTFSVYLSLINTAADATHNVMGYTLQLFDSTIITNVIQKREITTIYHADVPNIISTLTDLEFTGFFPAGENLRVNFMSNYAIGSGQNINITSGQIVITKLE